MVELPPGPEPKEEEPESEDDEGDEVEEQANGKGKVKQQKVRRQVRFGALGPLMDFLKKQGVPPVPEDVPKPVPTPEPEPVPVPVPEPVLQEEEESDDEDCNHAVVDRFYGTHGNNNPEGIADSLLVPQKSVPHYAMDWAPNQLTQEAAKDDVVVAAWYQRYNEWWTAYVAKIQEAKEKKEVR